MFFLLYNVFLSYTSQTNSWIRSIPAGLIFSLRYVVNTRKVSSKSAVLTMDETDFFRKSFKYFKKRNTPEVLKSVIDMESIPSNEAVIQLTEANSEAKNCATCDQLGLIPHQFWNKRSLKDLNGFFHIQNPFTMDGQRRWIQKCLELYPQKPSVTNLDLHNKNVNVCESANFLDKLSWATLGYHYNWDIKKYDPDKYSCFPECLESLSKHIASCMRFEKFRPEAAIVNYYNKKSTLCIHNDCSEEELNEPIISFSFGQTAIFLIGTSVRSDKPRPIFLRSGDIVVMSGKCRLSYHAVPAIITESVGARYSTSENDSDKDYYRYIRNHRINISVRQVYR